MAGVQGPRSRRPRLPCNQFGGQEPGSAEDIGEFCRVNHGVTFPLFDKVEVNGDDAHPLFRWLRHEARGALGSEKIKWNFTKFLVGRATAPDQALRLQHQAREAARRHREGPRRLSRPRLAGMPESAEEYAARVVAAQDPTVACLSRAGRSSGGTIFPFEVEGLLAKAGPVLVDVEPPRRGEDPDDCHCREARWVGRPRPATGPPSGRGWAGGSSSPAVGLAAGARRRAPRAPRRRRADRRPSRQPWVACR